MAWNIWDDYEQRIAAQEKQSQSMASALEEHAARTFGEADQALISVMEAIQAKGGLTAWDERSLHEMLRSKIQRSPQLRGFNVVNPSGLTVANSGKYPIEGIIVTDRNYFQHHAASPTSDLFIDQPFKNKLDQQWRINLSRRLNNPDGTFGGLVSLTIDPHYFDRLYAQLDIGSQGKITLIKQDGPVLIQTPFSEAAMTFNFNKKPLLTTYLPKEARGTFHNPTAGVDDSNCIVSYRKLDAWPILAVIFLLKDEFMAPWRANTVKQLAAGATTILLAIALSILLLRRLKELEVSSVKLVSQEEDLRSAHGKLQQAYNETEVKVQERTADLNLITQNLEEEITERKHAEKALRESEERLQLVLKGSHLGYWDWDVNTGEVMRNDQWAKMLGYTLQEIEFNVGQWDSLIHPDDRALAWKTIQDHLEGQTPAYECEYRMLTKDGQYRWILDRAKIVERDQEGRPLRMSGTHSDISERKQAEKEKAVLQAQLHQAQKMEAIATLAGGLAHNFNNILWAVMGFTELTLYNLPENSKEKKNLQQALQACDRAKNIVSQFLTLSRRAEPERKKIQLEPLIEESLTSLKESLPSNIAVDQHIEITPGLISANPSRLKEMLGHLYSNAAHAMQATGGTLGVKLEEITLNEEQKISGQKLPPGPYWQLMITDTGHGMDKAVMDRIFDPFFTTKEVGTGLGLGLSVVYGIVRSHDGSISVASEPDKGTTFTILLPKMEN